jgi:hypothetical protein
MKKASPLLFIAFGLILLGGIAWAVLRSTPKPKSKPSPQFKVEPQPAVSAEQSPDGIGDPPDRKRYIINLPRTEDWQDSGIWVRPIMAIRVLNYPKTPPQPFKVRVGEWIIDAHLAKTVEAPSTMVQDGFGVAFAITDKDIGHPFQIKVDGQEKLYFRLGDDATGDMTVLYLMMQKTQLLPAQED